MVEKDEGIFGEQSEAYTVEGKRYLKRPSFPLAQEGYNERDREVHWKSTRNTT